MVALLGDSYPIRFDYKYNNKIDITNNKATNILLVTRIKHGWKRMDEFGIPRRKWKDQQA